MGLTAVVQDMCFVYESLSPLFRCVCTTVEVCICIQDFFGGIFDIEIILPTQLNFNVLQCSYYTDLVPEGSRWARSPCPS